jgi:Na+/H+ antiporter NhaD/arsenite permease-like protein
MTSETLALVIFGLTYLGIAVGEIPGLALDRTGIALLGAIAMVVAGIVPEREAVLAVDMPTILLLYSLMVISSQFRLGGFYTYVAERLVRMMDRPRRFLLWMMSVSALLSSILANDIVCLAFTPILSVALLRARLNPVPFLIGLAVSSNIGSAATIIGNPQNMLIGQVGHLHFGRFLAWCLVPSLVSHFVSIGLLLVLYRGRFAGAVPDQTAMAPGGDWPAFDAHQSRKGVLVTVAMVALFFTPMPRELTALVAAGILLCSRSMSTRTLLGLVDWHLITLFCGLFVVIRGIEIAGLPGRLVAFLGAQGWQLGDPYLLTGVSAILSNLVSNVPAVMLLVKFLDPAQPTPWYVLAVASTFAGNLILIGSIANLIVAEQARAFGIRISFREHARTGVPVTLASIAILLAWVAVAT